MNFLTRKAASPSSFAAAVGKVALDSSIQEVILSGGDPLLVDDDLLEDLIKKLASIPHVQRLRIHSRLPVVLPSRITEHFLRIMNETRLTVCLVIHSITLQSLIQPLQNHSKNLAKLLVYDSIRQFYYVV